MNLREFVSSISFWRQKNHFAAYVFGKLFSLFLLLFLAQQMFTYLMYAFTTGETNKFFNLHNADVSPEENMFWLCSRDSFSLSFSNSYFSSLAKALEWE